MGVLCRRLKIEREFNGIKRFEPGKNWTKIKKSVLGTILVISAQNILAHKV